MAGPWTGRDGAIYMGGSEIGYCDSWSVSTDKEEIEVTKLNATAKEYLSGLTSHSLSASGSITDDTSLKTLINQFMKVDNDSAGASVSSVAAATLNFKLYVNLADSGSKSYYVDCSAISSGLELSTDPGSLGKWSFNGRISGDPTFTEETE